jgi:hypothetical protein
MVSYIVDIKQNGHWEPRYEYRDLLVASAAASYVSEILNFPARLWRYELSGLTLVGIFNPPVSLD